MHERILFMIAAGLALAASGLAISAARAAGDANNGSALYDEKCTGCHSLDANRVGPMHRGVYGRKAGSVRDFDYSDALKRAAVVWDEATLDRWLSGPPDFVPGSKMGFRVGSPADRADLIAFLRAESGK